MASLQKQSLKEEERFSRAMKYAQKFEDQVAVFPVESFVNELAEFLLKEGLVK